MDNIDWGHLLFQFDGRVNRAKFWLAVLIVWVVGGIVGSIFGFRSAIYFLVGLVLLWPYLAAAIKRGHDRGKSGWWMLIGLVPIIGQIWVLVELGFLAGTAGPNQYGADPLASPAPEAA